MKSIIQEAPTLAKAIEQGWEKAGKPAEFTIRVLEEPVRNFFGFTTRSAKVAVLFSPEGEQKNARPGQKNIIRQAVSTHKERPERAPAVASNTGVRKNTSVRSEPNPQPRREPHTERNTERHEQSEVSQWTPEMTTYAQSWVQDALQAADKQGITFTVEPQRLHLRITFNTQLLATHDREKQLFASLALLLLQALKSQFKVPLRGHKIVLTHEGQGYGSEAIRD